MDHNNTSFPVQVTALLKETYNKYLRTREHCGDNPANEEAQMACILKYYQFLVRALMTNPEFGSGVNRNGRGLLVYHKMGLGKTYLAVSVAMAMWDQRRPIVLAPKSLHSNFRSTIQKLIHLLHPDSPDEQLQKATEQAFKRFDFISMDAYNTASQITRAVESKGGSLEGSLLLVDEAHNLFRAIINSSGGHTNARRLYEMIMNTKNIRIMFFTGTPSSKDPFEIVPCVNMLAGWEILPTQYDVFYRLYIDKALQTIKNSDRLANRLSGFVSYAGYALPPTLLASDGFCGTRPEDFPDELPLIIERIEMATDQYRQYLLAREKEESERAGKGPPHERLYAAVTTLSLPGSERESGSTYYVRSRMLSNFAVPREDDGTREQGKAFAEISSKSFNGDSSPKIMRIMSNIGGSEGPVLIYSQFVGGGGVKTITRFLENEGYSEFVKKGDGGKGYRYATIVGETPAERRNEIQDAWNSLQNAHGEVIRVLLISKTGSEGLDLKYGRQIHILEPYWDKSREDQVKARIIRLGSHRELPEHERKVQPFLYISIPNTEVLEGIPPNSREEKTIDEKFHERAIVKHRLNAALRDLLERVSIECNLYSQQPAGKNGCWSCQPTNEPLFHENPVKDLMLPNACVPVIEKEIEAREMSFNNRIYYYEADSSTGLGFRFYYFDKALEAYVAVDTATRLYLQLVTEITQTKFV